MDRPRIYADFHNADARGRLRLNCIGTLRDLAREGIRLRAGLGLTLYCEDLETEGRVEYAEDEGLWAAAVVWKSLVP